MDLLRDFDLALEGRDGRGSVGVQQLHLVRRGVLIILIGVRALGRAEQVDRPGGGPRVQAVIYHEGCGVPPRGQDDGGEDRRKGGGSKHDCTIRL